MKKLITLGVILLSANVFCQKNDLKKNFIDSCKKEVQSSIGKYSEKDLGDYCSCAANKVAKDFTSSELEKLDNGAPEMKDKLVATVEPCVAELRKQAL